MTAEAEDPATRGASGAEGDCARCGVRHALPEGRARAHALEVMEEFRQLERLDYRVASAEADPKLRFEHLFAARGNMFGVLECLDREGQSVFLRAFSSLAEGVRQIDGWVLPILSASVYHEVILPAQEEIKRLTSQMKRGGDVSTAFGQGLAEERRRVSQSLWEEMCSLYRFRNFRGEERVLREAVLPGTPLTGGMGECCAPKLLQHAALNGLRPLSIAEFYWGDSNSNGQREGERAPARSDSNSRRMRRMRRDRAHAEQRRKTSGAFYPSCEARCQPLLGFMLCGMDG